MEKSLSIETMWSDIPFYDRFAKVREAGFRYVEFDGWTELVFSRVTEELHRHGLKLASISGTRPHALPDPGRHEDFLEFLSQTIAVAKSFSCANIVIASEADADDFVRAAGGKPDFSKIAAAIRVLTEAARMAAKAGLTLLVKSRGDALGDMPPSGVPSAGDVVRLVGSPALRMLYEAKRGERVDAGALSALHKFKDVIRYVQVSDNGARPAGGADGLADIRTALTRELGYMGIVGFRFRTAGDGAQSLEEIRRF